MMVLDDLKDQIPLREISRISGISLSGYYTDPGRGTFRGLIHPQGKGSKTLHQRGQHTDIGECGQY